MKQKLLDAVGAQFFTLRLVAALSAIIVGLSFCVGPSAWHQTPAFYYVNLLDVPWFVYGIWLAITGVCLFFAKTRPIGYLMGGIIYSFFAISTWLATIGGHTGLFAPCNLTTVAVFCWEALKISIYDQTEPHRKAGN